MHTISSTLCNIYNSEIKSIRFNIHVNDIESVKGYLVYIIALFMAEQVMAILSVQINHFNDNIIN